MAKLSLNYIEEAAIDIEAFSRFELKVVIIVYIRKQENKKQNHVIAIISDTQKEHP